MTTVSLSMRKTSRPQGEYLLHARGGGERAADPGSRRIQHHAVRGEQADVRDLLRVRHAVEQGRGPDGGGQRAGYALPAAVGAVAGVYAARGIRVFDNATIALSVLTGVGAVLALYALTSAIIALSMRKARPKQLMAADKG